MNMEGILNMYRLIIEGAFQALDDGRGYSVAVSVTADGVSVEKYATFADESSTSETIAAHPTSAMESLARLPAEAVSFFGISGDMQRLMEWGWSINASMLGSDTQQKKKFEAVQEVWQEADFGDIVGSFALGSADDGLFRCYAMSAKFVRLLAVHVSPNGLKTGSMFELIAELIFDELTGAA